RHSRRRRPRPREPLVPSGQRERSGGNPFMCQSPRRSDPMNGKTAVALAALLFLGELPSAPCQDSRPGTGQSSAPGPRERFEARGRADQLDKASDEAMQADRWSEAIAKADELWALCTQSHGAEHFKTVDADWRVKTLRRVAALPREDRVAYISASQ